MNVVSRYFVGMLNRPPAVALAATLSEESRLPKLIHQTFPSKVLPPALHANAERLRELNPTWQYRLYDDADIAHFIRSAYGGEVFQRFERIDQVYGAARADLFRYLLMYKLGGVYLDIKSAARRPLDTVLQPDERYIIAQWPHGEDARFKGAGWHEETKHVHNGEFQQWFIVAAPGHPFLKAVIERVLRNIAVYSPALHGVGKKGVLRVTGPIAYTLAIETLLASHVHRRVDAERDLGFEYSIFPTVDQGNHAHLRLFEKHYSTSQQSLIRFEGISAAVNRALMTAQRLASKVRNVGPTPP